MCRIAEYFFYLGSTSQQSYRHPLDLRLFLKALQSWELHGDTVIDNNSSWEHETTVSEFNPLPDDKFYSSKLKEFADDNFKFDENGRKLSKRVENTVGKREIARYEQFLFFPQCFQKACFKGASKGVIVWEWVKQQYLNQRWVVVL